MGSLDLTGVRLFLESLMEDSRVEVLAEQGAHDDVLDETTGDLTATAPAVVYDGPGLVLPMGGEGSLSDVDTQTAPVDSDTTHKLMLPLSQEGDIRLGHVVTVKAVSAQMGDAATVGDTFEVTQPPASSMVAVARFAYLKPARP
jgi:hypothetical protein